MIVLWGESDLWNKVETDWHNERIIYIQHQREPIPSYVKTTVRKFGDDYKGKIPFPVVYNHYVPYTRISKALIDAMVDKPRNEIVKGLQTLCEKFRINNPRFTREEHLDLADEFDPIDIEPYLSKFHFHYWVNQVFQGICDWPLNIFLGPSIGDKQGTRIDLPWDNNPNLGRRLGKALNFFHEYIQNIDLNDTFGGFAWYQQSRSRDGTKDALYFSQEDFIEYKKLEEKYGERGVQPSTPTVVYDDDTVDEYFSDLEGEVENARKTGVLFKVIGKMENFQGKKAIKGKRTKKK